MAMKKATMSDRNQIFIPGLAIAVLIASQTLGSAQTVLVRSGAEIDGTLTTTITSKTDHDGDPFTLDAASTWFYKNPLPTGSVVEGHLEGVAPAAPTRKATMRIIIDDVRFPDGKTTPLRARVDSLKEFEPRMHLLRDSGVIVGSAIVGHVLSKKSGRIGGTLAGTATGFALVSTMKSDIVVKKGTLVRLRAVDAIAE
jgi:hypothetical protein